MLLNKKDRIDRTHLAHLFIDGSWVSSTGDSTSKIICPSTEIEIAEVVNATEQDMDRAVDAARRAFDHGPWPRMRLEERSQYLSRLAEALHKRVELLGYAWTEQVGMLHAFSSATRASGIETITQYIEWAKEVPVVEKRPTFAPIGYQVREPVGVVAAIAPWNSPFITVLHKAIPALITGCTVIVKPAPETPLEAYIIAECIEEVGFPPGVFNLVVADRSVSEYLVRNPRVDKVSFTGSLRAGRKIASLCADRIGRVTLELGGKSSAIILDDYDLETAASSLAGGISILSGQNCAALTRLIISRHRHDEFVECLSDQYATIKVGDPYDPETNMGPLALKRQLEQVERYVALGRQEGAKLVSGGNRPAKLKKGYYYEPTIFSHVDNRMTVAQEEIFGPVVCVIPCEDKEDAIRISNDSKFGLAGAVYTNDSTCAMEVARQLRTGTVAQNNPWADFAIGFGGFKESGLGREGGVQGLMPYYESKTILLTSEAA